MRAIYSAVTGAAVALVAATAKTALSVITPATFGADLTRMRIGFDGITATDKAVLVELVSFTADGTGTAGTVNQVAGRSIVTGFTSKYAYAVEPTTPTVLDTFLLTPIGGVIVYDFGSESPDVGISTVLGLRLTAPTSAVNARASLWFGRC
jgi:hypothetical protein